MMPCNIKNIVKFVPHNILDDTLVMWWIHMYMYFSYFLYQNVLCMHAFVLYQFTNWLAFSHKLLTSLPVIQFAVCLVQAM